MVKSMPQHLWEQCSVMKNNNLSEKLRILTNSYIMRITDHKIFLKVKRTKKKYIYINKYFYESPKRMSKH